MKNQVIKLNTYKSFVMVVLITLAFTACVQKNTNNNKPDATVTNEVDIHTAALTGNLEAINMHIEKGSNIDLKEQKGGSTPLITAAVFGNFEVAKKLIEHGADINITNNDGATALHSAAFFCNTKIVELLIANNIDQSIKNNFGATAYESVAGSFNDLKPIYIHMKQQLAPLGLDIDLNKIETTRPVIAKMLQ